MAFDLTEIGSNLLSNVASRAVGAASDLSVDISKGVEPQHAYRWEFLVHGFLGDSEAVKFYAQNCSIPEKRNDPVKVSYCGSSFYYQGKSSSDKTLTVRFYDNQDLDIYKFIYLWYNLMTAGRENAMVNPINYMKSGEVRLLDTTERIITEQFVFQDMFPTNIGEVSLDYSASEIMTFDVTFQFNDMDVGYGALDAVGDAVDVFNGVRSLF